MTSSCAVIGEIASELDDEEAAAGLSVEPAPGRAVEVGGCGSTSVSSSD
jgi:hypothetical protein